MNALAENPEGRGHGGRVRILVLDDQESLCRLFTRILELHGYEVRGATSASGALAICDAEEERFDLLLCDLVLPGLDGREAANLIQARQPGMKVLFMSGYASMGRFRRELEASGVAFLSKPFGAPTLVEAVDAALAG